MKNIALIACTNGYGHIRRLLYISQSFKRKDVQPFLFAPEKVTRYLGKKFGIKLPIIIDFDTQTKIDDWKNGRASDWINKIEDLSKFDSVLSDNLIDVLILRPDAWLCGSFFWHEGLDGISQIIVKKQKSLLLSYKPNIFSSSIFTSKILMNYENVHRVGLFGKVYKLKKNLKTNALIAMGKGGIIPEKAALFVKNISLNEKIPFDTVWVDDVLLPKSYPHWMKSAQFDSKMFENLKFAIIRPGIGTVTEAILTGAIIFSFYEKNNLEMKENAKIIEKINLGFDCKTLSLAWRKALQYVNDNKQKLTKKNISNSFDPTGGDDVAKRIIKNYNGVRFV